MFIPFFTCCSKEPQMIKRYPKLQAFIIISVWCIYLGVCICACEGTCVWICLCGYQSAFSTDSCLILFFFLLRQVPSPNLEPTDWLHMIGLLALVIETIKLNLSFALCLTKWLVSWKPNSTEAEHLGTEKTGHCFLFGVYRQSWCRLFKVIYFN